MQVRKMSDHQRNNNNHNPGPRKGKNHDNGKQQQQQTNASKQQPPQTQQQLVALDPQHQPTPAGVAACLVCYAPLTHPGITSCDHNEICALCHLRLRFLHQDMKCPICKNPNELVIVDSYEGMNEEPHKLFTEYPTPWGDDEDHLYMGDAYVYRGDSVKMFFEKEYYEKEVVPLFGFKCHNCNEYTTNEEQDADQDNHKKRGGKKSTGVKTTVRALQEHLKAEHGLSLCQLCVDHKRDFVAKLPRFTPPALQQHLRNGDGPHSGFSGHPLCEFCKPTRFYDSYELFRHLQKDHYKCHVCEQQGLDHQYFRDYSSLAKHFERMHFLCPHGSCMEIRFVVFSNELDLRKHLREIHGEVGGDTKLQLEFRYKSSRQVEDQSVPTAQDFQYGLDGQAFVPEALVAGNNSNLPHNPTGIGMHPAHMERTAQLRAQAAQVRQVQDAATAFPALHETVDTSAANAPSGGPLQIGWTSSSTLQRVARHGNHGAVTEEHFPSLPTAARDPMAQRQFAAIRSAVTQPQAVVTSTSSAAASATPNWTSSSAATAAAFPALATRSVVPSMTVSSAASASDSSAARVSQAIPNNRLENLAPDNFPALAGPSRPKSTATTKLRPGRAAAPAGGTKYNAAEELAARLRRQNLTTEPSTFPALGRATSATSQQDFAPVPKQKPPSIQDTTAFPPPPTPSNAFPALRMKSTGSAGAVGNVLQVPVASATSLKQGEATVEEMKSTLGTIRYKKLKALTKEFGSDQLSPQSFCDQAATLFDKGLADADYLRYIPLILSSFPNTMYAQQALRYIQTAASARASKYDAAEQLAARLRQQPLDTEPSSFPALGRTTSSSSQQDVASVPKPKAPPSIQDTTAFPPPPAPSSAYPVAVSNVLQVPATSAASLQQGEATVEDMKAALGTARYKKLKSLTKEFASDQLSPQSFCDQAADLFDKGVADADYLRYVPLILSSFPNTIYAQQALRYIQEMRVKAKSQTKTATTAAVSTTPTVAAPPGWSAPPAAVTTPVIELDVPIAASASFASTAAHHASHSWQMAAAPAATYSASFGKKPAVVKNSWGSGASPAVLATSTKVPARASVTLAASQEGPQTGTATKYMAKQQKLQNASANQNTVAGASKKKKEKDELRALAFGK